jgi:hypothetical protein
MMSNVLPLRISVKTMIETKSDAVTIYGFLWSFPLIEPPMTAGIIGKTHGARAVRMPARNVMSKRGI